MIFSGSDILTPNQLKRLGEHKYNCSGCSLLDPLMQPFWNSLVQKIPLWFSPNAMTISGLLVNIVTTFILIYYSPDAIHEVPRWAFLLCAIGIFVYQTLDSCDGKQARRTGTSTPLGELFDHGCDSLSTVFVALGVSIAVQIGKYPSWMFFQCFAGMVLFYTAHWQTYVCGTLKFGKFDVTETQYICILIHLVSAICGPSFWSIKIPTVYIELKLLPTFVGMLVASLALYSHCTVIFTGGVGKNGSTVAGTSVLSPFIPMGLVVLSAFVIYQKSKISIYEVHPCLYILAFGVVASKITIKLVVAHMTKSKVDYLDSIFIGPGMLFLNQYFDTFIYEYVVLWICLVYSVADFLHYCVNLCNQICSYLHIYLFSITPVPPKGDMNQPQSELDSAPLLGLISNDESTEHSVVSVEEV